MQVVFFSRRMHALFLLALQIFSSCDGAATGSKDMLSRIIRQTHDTAPKNETKWDHSVILYKDTGSYNYSYETPNGISVKEAGIPKHAEGERVAGGAYSYTSPEGQLVIVTWIADENGYRTKTRIGQPQDILGKKNSTDLLHGPFKLRIVFPPWEYNIPYWKEDTLLWKVDENGFHWYVYFSGAWSAAGVRPIG